MTDEQSLVSASFSHGLAIPVYDDGYGPTFIHRNSMGVSGIVRARTWEDAYSICEDEFFPSADEEAFIEPKTDHEQACWDEAYGYRPNGKGGPTPDKDSGIYAKDLNGDRLDLLTDELADKLGISLAITENQSWEVWTYDVWGNAEDGYEVNDRNCQSRNYPIDAPVTVFNVGTPQQFTSAQPTEGQIREALGIKPDCELDLDGDDAHIYVNAASDGYPLGELLRNTD